MSEVHKALAEWVDVYKANEVKALLEPDAVQTLLDEYEAERRARQEAEAQAAALREALEWALEEGGFDLWYYVDEAKIPPILDTSGGAGRPATIKGDSGKQYLAIVEAASTLFDAEVNRVDRDSDEWRLILGELLQAVHDMKGGASQ